MYDNTSGSNETIISSRVPSIKESVKESTFRRPLIPQAYHKTGTADAFKTQLDVSLITLDVILNCTCTRINLFFIRGLGN